MNVEILIYSFTGQLVRTIERMSMNRQARSRSFHGMVRVKMGSP